MQGAPLTGGGGHPLHPQVYPDKSTVSFSAGLHGWAFTLTTFARMYASKFGIDEDRMRQKLWGDNFFDPATKKWSSKQTDSPTCKRGFVQFIYEPIKSIIDLAMKDAKDKVFAMLEKLNGGSRCVVTFAGHGRTRHTAAKLRAGTAVCVARRPVCYARWALSAGLRLTLPAPPRLPLQC
jgi:hypothetical protein